MRWRRPRLRWSGCFASPGEKTSEDSDGKSSKKKILFVALAAAAIGALPRLLLADGWQRVAVTAAVSAASFAALLWRFALDDAERDIVREKALSRIWRRQ